MNLRKFYITVFTILSLFLFITGVFLLSHINTSDDGGEEKGLLDSIIGPLKGSTESFNVLVLGTDKVGSNTDTIMVVNFNPGTFKLNILSIPRDTRVIYNGGTHKINAAYSAGGSKLAADAVSKLLNTRIKHYIIINLNVFREIIDLLGGVDYYIPVDMDYDDPLQDLHIHLKKGQQHLDGKKAEQFMRFRQPNHYTDEIKKFYDGSDLRRIDAQQNFIREIIKQKLNIKYITKVNSIIKTIFAGVETDINLNEALKMSQNIGKLNTNEITTHKLPGAAEDGGSWFYIPDKNKISELVKQYFSASSGYADTKSSKGSNSTGNTTSNTSGAKPAKTNGGNGQDTKKTPTPAQTPTPKPQNNPDYTKDNPSNAETGFKDQGAEEP